MVAGPPAGVSAETPAAAGAPAAASAAAADGPPAASTPVVRTSTDLADGLVVIAESFLAEKVAGADDPEIYQVMVHAGTGVLAEPPAPASAGVSA